jgi:hypothetical protein
MKILLLALSILNPKVSSAAESLCGKAVLCGTYEAHVGENHSVMIVSDGGESAIKIAFERNGERQSEEAMHFRADGRLVLGEQGKEIGLGLCKDLTCYISMRPLTYSDTYLAIFQIFRFSEQTLEFEKLMSRTNGEQTKTKAVFYRK